ncbi:hypothetical protein ACSQ6I_22335 [Anabaena sp. WFMT]|uniref:hypothetical protein n=1 Tax=Anabaena sp. WFMT TaxID=3449730 RepID=UPI003F20E7A3
MIKDIPSPDDLSANFIASGTDFLNIAWETILYLLQDYAIIKANSEIENGEQDNVEVDNEYWKKVQRHLSTSLALIQQGNEFILKGYIAKKNPCLILSKDWQSQLQKDENVSFSEIKTIDASELIKIYNDFINPPLKIEFKIVFENLREKRNTVIHSVPKNLDIEYKDLLLNILEISDHLIGKHSWIKTRKTFLENNPNVKMIERDKNLINAGITKRVTYEIQYIIKLLEPRYVKKYFGISDKTQFWYICPHCYKAFELFSNYGEDFEEIPKLAQMKPKGANTTTLYCLVCDQTSEVSRRDCNRHVCNDERCPGNVISDLGICLTCGNLEKNPPMIPVTLKMPKDVVKKLEKLAAMLGFSVYQSLICAYIKQEMRADLEKLENNGVNALIASLKRHGVSDDVIHEALNELLINK